MTPRAFLAVAVGLLLASCKVDSTHEVFLSQVLQTPFESLPKLDLPVASTFRIEVSSTSKCHDAIPHFQEMLPRYYAKVAEIRCINEGLDDYLTFQARSPIVLLRDGNFVLGNGSISGLGAARNDAGELLLYAVVDTARQKALAAELKEEFSPSADIELHAVTAELLNDLPTPVKLRGPASFVNGEPVTSLSRELPPHDRLRVGLSDVSRAMIVKNGAGPIVAIAAAP